jgi:hypothetical protein
VDLRLSLGRFAQPIAVPFLDRLDANDAANQRAPGMEFRNQVMQTVR